ncbi:MAG: DUF192 domain-containing protein [Planctomycetes bacterium]|nr:DUF192 domain-containing protein [Planctomycetota bacterium]
MKLSIKIGIIALLTASIAGFVALDNSKQSTATGAAKPQTSVRKAPSGLPLEMVTIGGKKYELEVAANDASRMRGLSHRASIPAGTGMIFVHRVSDMLSYWMVDCLIDMDIAYLDRNGKVVSIYTMKVEPPRAATESEEAYHLRLKHYPSADDAIYALELPAGEYAKLGVKPGDTIALDHAKFKSYLH